MEGGHSSVLVFNNSRAIYEAKVDISLRLIRITDVEKQAAKGDRETRR